MAELLLRKIIMQSQSFISTLMRGRMGIYETRIFMHIVASAQDVIQGGTFNRIAYAVPGSWTYRIAIPLSELTQSHNYGPVKRACENLKNITCQHMDLDSNIWQMSGLITQALLQPQSGVLQIEVAKWVIRYIVDFRRGWRTYELQQALTIRNPFALRMYLITCSQTSPLVFSLDNLKLALLGTTDRYKNSADFLRRCLEPAKKELEEKQLNGFDFKTIHKGRGNAVSKVEILPKKREAKDQNIGVQRDEIATAIPAPLMNYLTTTLGFSTKELRGKNLSYFSEFCKRDGWQEKLLGIIQRMRMKRRGHGYLISAIKSEINK